MWFTTKVSGMHYGLLAKTKEFLAFIKALEQRFWYYHYFSFFVASSAVLEGLPSLTDFPFLPQSVGPNIAISFSVYETLRSLWQSQRWSLHILVTQLMSMCTFSRILCLFDFRVKPLTNLLTPGRMILRRWSVLLVGVSLALHHPQVGEPRLDASILWFSVSFLCFWP